MITATSRPASREIWRRTFPAAAVLSVRGPHAWLWTYGTTIHRHGQMSVTRTSP